MTVASDVLAWGFQTDNTVTTIGVVPAGQTWIIKSILAQAPVAVTGTIRIWVRDPAITGNGYLVNRVPLSNENMQWEGWVVAQAGNELRISAADGQVHYWISGARLVGAAP